MKTTFKKSETKFGCYGNDHDLVKSYKKDMFNIQQVLSLNIPLKDKFWFVRNNCELTNDQYRKLAIGVANIVLTIYELKYTNNKAPREAIQAAQDYLNGVIDLDSLRQKRAAAYAAYACAYACATAAYTAAAAADDAVAAADAADAAVDAAADAADAADSVDFKQQLLDFLIKFTKQ